MSLNVAFSIAAQGISAVEKKLAVTASNINNADKTGYTRKAYQTTSITSNGITTPLSGTVIQAAVSKSLIAHLTKQATEYANASTTSDYLSNYSQAFGSTAEGTATLSSQFSALLSALQSLEDSPSETSIKATVVSSAQSLVSQLNGLSQSVQDARAQASQDIATSVDTINTQLKKIEELNTQISKGGKDTASLEDERTLALQELSEQIGIQYFTDDQNQVRIYSSGGDLLLGSKAATLSYTDPGNATRDMAYPGGFTGITLNGKDITESIGTGTLGALITLRDGTLPAEQAKLDALAGTLVDSVNSALSQGTSYPPLMTVTGTAEVEATDTLSASGSLRIAVAGKDGTIGSYTDLDLSSYATVQDLLDGLNGIAGVSASIVDGNLTITSTDSSKGIALNPMDSDIGGMNAAQYFGINTLFAGSNAADIRVSDYLLGDSSALPTGSLSDSATLAIGDKGITSGDSSVTSALVDALGATQSFGAAGNFSAKNMSFSAYISAIIADVALQADTASQNADTASATYEALTEKLSSLTGVNINEETADMTALQSSYEANATLISTIRDMFESLLQAVG